MAAKDELGRDGEDRAVAYLGALGYTVLDRNWRCPQGEIDIVASDGDALCIVEVKTRRGLGYGHPFDAVDERRRGRLWRAAQAWRRVHPEWADVHKTLRIDVVGIIGDDPRTATIEHLRDLR